MTYTFEVPNNYRHTVKNADTVGIMAAAYIHTVHVVIFCFISMCPMLSSDFRNQTCLYEFPLY